MELLSKNELYHHGIPGMKWGVRRYQNEDGTLTAAGKKRYGTNLDLSDKSRQNVAKIRLGEARRRLDVAKDNARNGKSSDTRVADMQSRVRSAKKKLIAMPRDTIKARSLPLRDVRLMEIVSEF